MLAALSEALRVAEGVEARSGVSGCVKKSQMEERGSVVVHENEYRRRVSHLWLSAFARRAAQIRPARSAFAIVAAIRTNRSRFIRIEFTGFRLRFADDALARFDAFLQIVFC